jgi:hypothetical protein
MRIGIPFLALSEMVKLLESAKKDVNRAGTLPSEPYQLISFSWLRFAMQPFH